MFSLSLDDWTSRMRKIPGPGKLIQSIADADVEGLTKDPVPSVQVPDYLGVCSTCIENDRVMASGGKTPYLNVSYTVVNPNEGNIEGQRK